MIFKIIQSNSFLKSMDNNNRLLKNKVNRDKEMEMKRKGEILQLDNSGLLDSDIRKYKAKIKHLENRLAYNEVTVNLRSNYCMENDFVTNFDNGLFSNYEMMFIPYCEQLGKQFGDKPFSQSKNEVQLFALRNIYIL